MASQIKNHIQYFEVEVFDDSMCVNSFRKNKCQTGNRKDYLSEISNFTAVIIRKVANTFSAIYLKRTTINHPFYNKKTPFALL